MSTFHVMAGGTRAPASPRIRKIRLATVGEALAAGWEDFLAIRSDILLAALIYPVIGLCLALWSSGANMLPLLYPLATGFALLGPLAAIGIYEISRRREAGLDASASSALQVLKSPSLPAIVALGIILALAFVAWLASAQALYQALFGDNAPSSIQQMLSEILTTQNGYVLIVAGNAIGFAFAAVIFCASVISFPLLLDRDVGLAVAVRTSFETVFENPLPMAAWALIVAFLLAAGFASFLVGLAVVMPVLGHATWHLYRAVIPRAP